MTNSILLNEFIKQIWNNQAFELLEEFLHKEFKDHSLLPELLPGKEGTKQWVINTGRSFKHYTSIESIVSEGDECVARIKMKLQHIGTWREIEPTGIELFTEGYRHVKIRDGKIIDHWALIDGQMIENKLKEASHGCEIAK